jgi:hypothetical protein
LHRNIQNNDIIWLPLFRTVVGNAADEVFESDKFPRRSWIILQDLESDDHLERA